MPLKPSVFLRFDVEGGRGAPGHPSTVLQLESADFHWFQLEASWSCRDLKKPIKTNGFFNIFGITSFVLKIASSWPKLASSWLKLASSWLQVDSSWPQVDSSWPYVASSWLKLASSWLKLGPSWLQVGSGRAQNQLREAPGGSPEGSWDGLETLEKVWLTNTSEHDPRPSRQIMLRRLWRRFGSQIRLSMIRGSNDKSCSDDFGEGLAHKYI